MLTAAPGGLLVMRSFSAAAGSAESSAEKMTNTQMREREAMAMCTSREGWTAGTLPHTYIALLLSVSVGAKPSQLSTGRRGYLGKRASLNPSWHSINTDSLAETTRREWMQESHSPALSPCSCCCGFF